MSAPAAGSRADAEAGALGGKEGRRRVAWLNLFFNYANLAVTLVSGILLVPAYLRSFSLGTYGAWLASGNVLGMVGVVDGGVNLVLSQQLAAQAARGDKAGFARTVSAGLGVTAASGLLVVGLGLLLSPHVPGWVKCPAADAGALRWAFMVAAVGTGASLLAQGLGGVLQAWEAPRAAGLANVTASVLGLVATIVALALGWGVTSLAVGMAMRGGAGVLLAGAAVVLGWRRARLPRFRLEPAAAGALLRASAPVFASRVGTALLSNSESLILAVIASPTLAGVVALTGRIHGFAGLLLAPIGSSAFAGVARLQAAAPHERVREVLRELFGLSGAVTALLLGGAVAVNPGFVGLWVGGDAFGGELLSLALAVSAACTARFGLTNLMLNALGRPSGAAWIALIEAAARIPLTVVLVHHLGAIGLPIAAIATAVGVSGVLYAGQLRVALGGDGFRVLTAGVGTPVVALGLGAAGAAVWVATTWLGWVAGGAFVGVVLAATVLGLSWPARSAAARLLARPGMDGGLR
ncbi:MAG: lipopolysaccharide biosynthesis protein [Anaeromyxobacter sp.]